MTVNLSVEDILALPAGDFLDRLVIDTIGCRDNCGLGSPSRDFLVMATALQAYQNRRQHGYAVCLRLARQGSKSIAELNVPHGVDLKTQRDLVVSGGTFSVFAETLPLAACRALLIAAMGGWDG